MAKSKVKTDNFTTKKKYRTVRSALKSADQIWLKLGFNVRISKSDGEWTSLISQEEEYAGA